MEVPFLLLLIASIIAGEAGEHCPIEAKAFVADAIELRMELPWVENKSDGWFARGDPRPVDIALASGWRPPFWSGDKKTPFFVLGPGDEKKLRAKGMLSGLSPGTKFWCGPDDFVQGWYENE